MGRFTCNIQGIRTRDRSQSWASIFFFVKNYWNLIEKWEKLKELLVPLHIGEGIFKILKSLIENLLYEVHYLRKYIEEDYLFKVGLFVHVGRSLATMLKKSNNVQEISTQTSEVAPKPSLNNDNTPSLSKKKKKVDKTLAIVTISKSYKDSSPSKLHIPKDILTHQYIKCRRADELSIIQDHVQQAHDHIYDVEVKDLERQCIEEGFIRWSLKGVHLVQRKTGVEVEMLTHSQASDDSLSALGDDGIEIDLKIFFFYEDEDAKIM
ncbi:hypothetical protein IEQ34_015345 [Dendrobium chrysotoxum]|uniref:Uncharacterized protein n=1 Tax=Dendrobium chrysotoxum TaxID=161865 RepID=A0AAV7GIQ9_DENCH|nr:hypothetical protein IEQ34_015345 [Dendrobium chrysotoxum]